MADGTSPETTSLLMTNLTFNRPLLQAYRSATAPVERMYTGAPLRLLEGTVPRGLRGILYRNGPGKMEAFGEPYQHPFDGDGMVTRFSFDESGVHYTNRFVQTRELRAEAAAGRMLYRNFGTNLPGGLRRNFLRFKFKNAANTSVILHGGRLLALWEGGLPHALDPETLETHGPYDYDGRLRNPASRLERALAPYLPFSAHAKRDLDTGELVNFGTIFGRKNRLALYRVDARGVMEAPRFVPLDELSFVHDFVLTRRYAVFFLPAVAFDIFRALVGLKTPVASLRAGDGKKAVILLVPRDGGAPRRFEVSAGFVFHFVNGFDDESGRVILDAMRLPALPHADQVRSFLAGENTVLPQAYPTRFVVDAARGTVTEDRLFDFPAELPTIDPRNVGRPYRTFWSLASNTNTDEASAFLTRVVRVEMPSGTSRSRDFAPDLPGEPLFVPKPGAPSEQGWVLVLVYRAASHRSELVVLEADTLDVVCRLELPHHVPPGFHGTWVPRAGRSS